MHKPHAIDITASNAPPPRGPGGQRGPNPLRRGSASFALRGQQAVSSAWHSILGGLSAMLRPIDRAKEELVEAAVKRSEEKDSEKVRKESRTRLGHLFFYCIFLTSYSVISMVGRNDSALSPWTIYDMQTSLLNMFLKGRGATLVDPDSKKWVDNIDFADVRTVEDIYTWFHTTFHSAVYTSSTFDGGDAWRQGFVLGQQMLIGGIRIRQLRKGQFECGWRAPGKMVSGYKVDKDEVLNNTDRFTCYANDAADLQAYGCPKEEQIDEEGEPQPCPTPLYVFSNASSIIIKDKLLLKTGYHAASIGFHVDLPNLDASLAREKYTEMYENQFIDLQTRKLEIHATFWNFNIMRLTSLEFDFQLPVSGGVFPSSFVKVSDLYSCNIGSLSDLENCNENSVVRLIFEVAW